MKNSENKILVGSLKHFLIDFAFSLDLTYVYVYIDTCLYREEAVFPWRQNISQDNAWISFLSETFDFHKE